MPKISELPTISPEEIDGTETVPVVKDGSVGKATIASLGDAAADRAEGALADTIAALAGAERLATLRLRYIAETSRRVLAVSNKGFTVEETEDVATGKRSGRRFNRHAHRTIKAIKRIIAGRSKLGHVAALLAIIVPTYGQSNSLKQPTHGAPISISQRYPNTWTFRGGPHWLSSTDVNTTASGETDMVPLANTDRECPSVAMIEAIIEWATYNGHDLTNVHFFAVSGGKGGKDIADLINPVGEFWQGHRTQILTARDKLLAYNPGFKIICPYMGWIHGEADAQGSQTSYAAYKASLVSLQPQYSAMVQELLPDQVDPVQLVISQISYFVTSVYGGSNGQVHQAQFDAANENEHIHLTGPAYSFSRHWLGDGAHRNSIGAYREGRMLGRAGYEIIFENHAPHFLRPLGAIYSVNAAGEHEVRVKWDAEGPLDTNGPMDPLREDEWSIVKDYGFRIKDDTGDLTITAIRLENGNETVFIVNRALGANPKFRSAMDYIAHDMTNGKDRKIDLGAMSNLHDAAVNLDDSPANYVIAGQRIRERHFPPHCERPILKRAA